MSFVGLHTTPFGTGHDRDGWLRREVPELGARWLDVAEYRLREMVELEGERAPVPLNVAELLAPQRRDTLRLALLAQLTPADLEPVPGGCGVPWSGCPEHGDMLSHRGIVPGWYCDAEGHERYGEDTTFHRLRHCHEPAAAVLAMEGSELPVCAGHLRSELVHGEVGAPFAVIEFTGQRAA
ncbi:hypothetical protein [Nocardia bovistercoris]|uniref:Uncharacterized protein n=1 Tax=Nocardia bovistercoris TaxID=2785916 RepID=A0A931IDW5_9NOCA|nr:hypothetical protein [Nocardia bovistercoris]MBH0778738.1 hypothetical protein [Nocardia bovistercoris]